MSAVTDTVAALTAAAGVTAIVGSGNVKPYPLAKDAKVPALTYYVVDQPTTQAMTGSVFERRPRICLQCWAKTMAAVEALNEAVLAVVPSIGGAVTVADAGHDVPEPELEIKRREVDLQVLR